MYNPAHFAESRIEILRDFIKAHPFGALVSNGENGLEASHLPVFLDDEQATGKRLLRCHMARANRQWKACVSAPSVLLIFTGPDHYISPSWYPSKEEHGKVVPTWNYAAVHVYGQVRLFEGTGELLNHIQELTNANESVFPVSWRVADAPPDYIEALTRSIVGLEISIERMEGKWKASQNRPLADQAGVIEGLEALGSEPALAMAELVKEKRNSGKNA
jgi:transcriptional regulator